MMRFILVPSAMRRLAFCLLPSNLRCHGSAVTAFLTHCSLCSEYVCANVYVGLLAVHTHALWRLEVDLE